jgi:hypothetical protein
MAEIHENSEVMSLDSDFVAYRKSHWKVIPILRPERRGENFHPVLETQIRGLSRCHEVALALPPEFTWRDGPES